MARKAMLIDLARCAGCGGCVVACQMQNNTRPDVVWGTLDRCEWGAYPNAERCYLPHACMQCDSPACASACPTGASYTAADGVTLVDYEKCICCGLCVDACPYGARHINKTGENFFDAANPAPYEAYGVQRKNVVEKCIFCHDLVEQGGTPACVVNCPGKARAFGDIDDPTSTVVQKIQGAKRIGETGFYYLTPDSIPADMIISKVMVGMEPADLITPEPQTTVKAAPGISPVAIGVGAGVVVAAGVGAGLAINAKRKKAVDAGTASSTGAASSADTSAKEQKEDGNDA